jgi:hypothetical protein
MKNTPHTQHSNKGVHVLCWWGLCKPLYKGGQVEALLCTAYIFFFSFK